MAKHTEIPNALLECLVRCQLSSNQWQVLLYIMRKTWGWQKKADFIANSQIVNDTGLGKTVVSRQLSKLSERQFITRNKKLIGIEEDWRLWQQLAKQSTSEKLAKQSTINTKLAEQLTTKKLAEQLTELAEQSTKVSSPVVTQKKKETIQKKDVDVGKRTFEEYRDGLRVRFSDLDFDLELEKFHLYWGDNGRRPKNPKIALLNWLDKARRIKGGKDNGTSQHTNRRVPKPEEYKQPHEY